MTMAHILICDNNTVFTDYLKDEIARLFPDRFTVSVCSSADTLRAEAARQTPDIVLMDILLGEDNGIELVKDVFPRDSGVSVIFISGYAEYCTDVYEAEHVYFLLKPIKPEQLRQAIEKALAVMTDDPGDFPVRESGGIRRVAIDGVYSIESFYRKLRIRTQGEVIECYGTLSELPENVRRGMIQCHKSFLVNPAHIQKLDGASFRLTDGSTVPISRNRLAESRQAFLDYCSRHLEKR